MKEMGKVFGFKIHVLHKTKDSVFKRVFAFLS
ncbi:hypothetical protein OVS_04370 [Mycoplasma ovis str. Michigan]|uniref:Transposase n=1 Tax=Mycoplasma ovis str. Michigan TaxID=1415773 RepID=A0ABM5P2N8_9MOLU|nr:hypothetical protein OVS_04370 [Mycoplasma ovis str. Michigan]